jgi:tetratricopeptide (TPR) repeat protein
MAQDTSTKGYKPADLAKMEMEFAKDPKSKIFVELATAYIEQNRLVEAMVVAKKGMKNYPLDGHLALARVYFKQQKYPKVLEELSQSLAIDADNIECLELKGDALLKSGEETAGIEAFKQVMAANPAHERIRAFLIEKGIEVPPIEKPKPVEEHRPTEGKKTSGSKTGARKPQFKKVMTPTVASTEDFSSTPDWMRKQAARRTMILIGILAVISISIISGIAIYAHKIKKLDRLSKEVTLAMRSDTFTGYLRARGISKQAISTDASNAQALATAAYIDAILYGEFGESDDLAREAAGYIESALKSKDSTSTLTAAQALLRFYTGDAKGAESVAMEGFQKNQSSSKILLTLGIIQVASGNYDNALESFKRARLLETGNDPKNYDPRSLAFMADLSSRQGAIRQAFSQYELLLKAQPDHIGAVLGRAQIFADIPEKLGDAENEAKKVLGMPQGTVSKKEQARAAFILSIVYRTQDKEAEAAKYLSQALELDPKNAQFQFQLARRYTASREFDKAKQAFEKAIKLDGKKPEFYREYAEMQCLSGDYEGSIQNVTRAMMYLSDRDKSAFYLLRAKALRMKKDLKEARKEITKAFALNSEDPYAHFELAMLLFDQGSVDDASAEAENAATGFQASMSPRKEAEALVLQARIKLNSKDAEATEDLLKKALEKDRTNADAYYYSGKLFASNKKTAGKAREFFEIYLKLAPNGEYAQKAREGL